MSEDEDILRLDSLRDEIRDSVKAFARKLLAGLGSNLRSITIVGSSLTEDFKAGQSDINTVLILGERTMEALNGIAGLAKPMRRRKLSAPLLMTSSYIERSVDVFGVEFLDFQLTHRTIWGDDPFASLSFIKQDVRLQCERELKAMLIRLRQGYISAGANKRLVRDILISTVKGLVPILRAMLWLKDLDRPVCAEPTFRKASGELSINMDPLIAVQHWRYAKARLREGETEGVFESIYGIAEQLAVMVDKLEV